MNECDSVSSLGRGDGQTAAGHNLATPLDGASRPIRTGKKVKFSRTRYRALDPDVQAVSPQVT